MERCVLLRKGFHCAVQLLDFLPLPFHGLAQLGKRGRLSGVVVNQPPNMVVLLFDLSAGQPRSAARRTRR